MKKILRIVSTVLQYPRIKTVCVDLADWDTTRSCVEDVGFIDILVNNAGVGSVGQFVDVPKDEVDR